MNVQELVAQTFDEGALNSPENARIGAQNRSARQCVNTVNPGLTASKERLHE